MGFVDEIKLSRRIFKDSGYLELTNTTTITTNGKYGFILDERFKPYDEILVVNLNPTADARIRINGNQLTYPLPAGNKAHITDLWIRDVDIENITSTTISANEIKLFYRCTGKEGKRIIERTSTAGNLAFGISTIKGLFFK